MFKGLFEDLKGIDKEKRIRLQTGKSKIEENLLKMSFSLYIIRFKFSFAD